MKNFSLITNKYKDRELVVTREIIDYIEQKGGKSNLLFTFEGDAGEDFRVETIPVDTECVMVLGGDGTLIRVATRLEHLRVPLVGVNLGRLGYLCELEQETVFEAIDRLMEDSYTLEERMMLCGKLASEEHTRTALNDIVIHQIGKLAILKLNVYVNGEFLGSFSGDGMIVATPTGATGYSLSAGGPIVDPKARMLLLTPINAHNLNSRSIVLSEDAVVEIEASGRQMEGERAAVSFDGDLERELVPGERIVVQASEDVTGILRLSKDSFLEIMRKKLENYN